MSTKTIPAVTIMICDFCKTENPSRRSNASLTVTQAALDWGNNPCADASYTMDACDGCIAEVNRVITALIKKP